MEQIVLTKLAFAEAIGVTPGRVSQLQQHVAELFVAALVDGAAEAAVTGAAASETKEIILRAFDQAAERAVLAVARPDVPKPRGGKGPLHRVKRSVPEHLAERQPKELTEMPREFGDWRDDPDSVSAEYLEAWRWVLPGVRPLLRAGKKRAAARVIVDAIAHWPPGTLAELDTRLAALGVRRSPQ